ncbi:conserved hypothetical protein [Ricinus communis]|uniref:Uncharacterized protein n=1 Tax=Ricinus communis TaxID=3988 RepID=B9R795_RICCO|nr:conserved hypothetical protein [Ricinus communis]
MTPQHLCGVNQQRHLHHLGFGIVNNSLTGGPCALGSRYINRVPINHYVEFMLDQFSFNHHRA